MGEIGILLGRQDFATFHVERCYIALMAVIQPLGQGNECLQSSLVSDWNDVDRCHERLPISDMERLCGGAVIRSVGAGAEAAWIAVATRIVRHLRNPGITL